MEENEILKILIVDDDEVDRMAVRRALKTSGLNLELAEAETAESAFTQLQKGEFDCAFVDYRLPDKDGLALVRELRENGIKIPLIALTGQGDEQIAVELMKAGASDYLSKFRISPARLAQALHNAIRVYQAEKEAAIAYQQKEELAKQREDFVSRMTHDLRTPLVAANRMLGLFQEGVYGQVPQDMDKAIDIIIRNNKNLLEMVNNLLEVYCHEAGAKRLNFTNLDLKQIIEEVVQELNPLAEEKFLKIFVETENGAVLQVVGDRLELRRVMINLISNALKFTDEGKIIIRLLPAEKSNPYVTVEVEDTGAGIAPEDQPQLFERFRYGNHRRSTSGLGLYLSRRILEAHHGSIFVTSQLDVGSIFSIRLPASFL
ncbi:MAG: Sensor histidine kinase RcsC [Chroococcopsis gigantea SAG 12.99]|jgi:two-component system sensor histidine kinase/response regulator|nr:hybrid sensor histidine kinase/response regulator [Chlorogloea purpurea SAG 13.99]MDV2998902.1 Sensor histidine kinase RcsC [Chroococcopsis gigantea SAG 12.99]